MATGRQEKHRENHREDVAGRANVEDTPELLAYYDELERLEAGALWTVANKIEPWAPKSSSVPVLWRYEDLRRGFEIGLSHPDRPVSARLHCFVRLPGCHRYLLAGQICQKGAG